MLSVISRKVLAMSRSVRFSQRNLFWTISSCENHNQIMLSSFRRSSSESGGVSPVDEPSKNFIINPLPTMHPSSHDFKDSSEPKIQKSLSPLMDLPIEVQFEQWIAQNGRVYKDAAEKAHRFVIFKNNVEYTNALNAIPGLMYTVAVNKFADLTNAETRRARGVMWEPYPSEASTTASFNYDNVTDVLQCVNWRNHGAVTPVKDQCQCESCWAFSVVAASTEGSNGEYKVRSHSDDSGASLFQVEETNAGRLGEK